MKRIDTSTKATDLFGAGKHGFRNSNLPLGVAATDFNADWPNNLQEEIARVVEAAGIALDGTVFTQLLQAIRSNAVLIGTDAGAANASVLSFTTEIAALADGMVLWFKAAATNTGATTLNVSGLGTKPVVGGGHVALQGGEIVANGRCMVIWSAPLNSFILIECTGGALQVGPGSKPSHAAQVAQVAGVVGSVRSLRAMLNASSKILTFTADEVIVETALGGTRYCVANVNKSINLATVGAGGMDVGSANNGFTAVYLFLNPTTGATALLGADASAAAAPQVYGGANAPAGYTASALISVLATQTATGFAPFSQMDRTVDCSQVLSQSTSTSTGAPISWGVSTIPKNAIECKGSVGYSCNVASQGGTSVFGNAAGVGPAGTNLAVNAGSTVIIPFSNIVITTPQTLWYTGTTGGGTPTYQVYVSGYKF